MLTQLRCSFARRTAQHTWKAEARAMRQRNTMYELQPSRPCVRMSNTQHLSSSARAITISSMATMVGKYDSALEHVLARYDQRL